MELNNMYRDKKSGFTFVEVILVMALVSFLYIVTMKVIQHNLDQKVPVYVYNLYKNLDNESKLLTKKLIDDVANGSNTALKEKINTLNSTDSKMNAILETIDAKTYANILANDFNTVGQIDNDGVSEFATISEKYKDIYVTNTNNMSRSFSYTVKDDGTPNIKYTPERDTTKMQSADTYACYLESDPKRTLKQGVNCMYAPTKTNITNLITSQNENQWYKIDSVANVVKVGENTSTLKATVYDDESVLNPDIQITTSNTLSNIPEDFKSSKQSIDFVVDSYSLKNKKALFSTNNNLKFHILTTKTETNPGKVTLKRVYNYTLAYQQDAICPPTDKTNVCDKKHMQTVNGRLKNPTPNAICYFKKKDLSDHLANNSGYTRGEYAYTNFMTPASGDGAGAKMYCIGNDKIKRSKSEYGITLKTWETTYFKDFPKPSENISSCSVRLDNIQKQEMLIKNMKKISDKCYYYLYFVNVGDMTKKKATVYNPFCDLYSNIRPSVYTQKAKEYYARWNKFFNTTKIARDTRNELNSSITEDNMSNTITFTYPAELQNNLSYPNHFIYVAIDTSFNKGEMGKNIFVFEQFGSKIIPVGYLANNQNTPLKFDVITRNPETFKLEKVNYYDGMEKRPLTFCEAMRYTGDKFSEYCDCKDGDKVIVTQYSQMAVCDNNFGCIIKPVQPSNVAPKFKLF